MLELRVMSTGAPFTSIEAIVEPYSGANEKQQFYCRTSIARYCLREGIPFRETGSHFPNQLRFLRRARESSRVQKLLPWGVGTKAIDSIAGLLGADPKKPEDGAGSYLFHRGSLDVKVCIDGNDSGVVTRPDLLEWSDLYFKTNFWPERVYPPKVVPLAHVSSGAFRVQPLLKELRNAPKELDLFASFGVRGGVDEIEGVEHGLGLVEALARAKCKKKVLALLIAGDISAAARRLDKAGVPWTTKWMPQKELWDYAAKSRLNIVRHGMHQCMAFRMSEILAIGGCPVLDYAPRTRWHVPLEENIHYLNLQATYRPGEAAFDAKEVADRVECWLASPDLAKGISQNAARYFDEHLTLEVFGGYIVQEVSRAAG